MKNEARTIWQWLAEHSTDKKGSGKKPILSNRTDNESGKLPTVKGVGQGDGGVAAVDDKHQIVVGAQAHGTGSEQVLLPGFVGEIQPAMNAGTRITADAGYHSEANLKSLKARQIDGYIADSGYPKRDPRYEEQEKHTVKDDALWDKSEKDNEPKPFRSDQFKVAEDLSHCLCPAGQKLLRSGRERNLEGLRPVHFRGTRQSCGQYLLRTQCLRKRQTTVFRQVAFFLGKHDSTEESAIERMRRKIDSREGRRMIARRFAAVEPVFGNLRHNKRLRRFTLRGRERGGAPK